MGSPVMRRHVAVFGLDQNVTVLIDQDRAKRMIAMGHGAARNIERAAHKMFVGFGDRHIGALGSLASSFETARSLSSGAHSRDPLAPPQDEVQEQNQPRKPGPPVRSTARPRVSGRSFASP